MPEAMDGEWTYCEAGKDRAVVGKGGGPARSYPAPGLTRKRYTTVEGKNYT